MDGNAFNLEAFGAELSGKLARGRIAEEELNSLRLVLAVLLARAPEQKVTITMAEYFNAEQSELLTYLDPMTDEVILKLVEKK